jgi:hypothetical protein
LHKPLATRRTLLKITEKIRYFALAVNSQHNINTLLGSKPFGRKLGITTGNYDKRTGVLAYKFMNSLPALLFRLLSDGTTVDYTNIGNLASLGSPDARLLHHTLNARSLREVQFATECIINSLFIFELWIIHLYLFRISREDNQKKRNPKQKTAHQL